MSLSGKYNFSGIKKLGAAGLRLALASSPKTSWLLRFRSLTDLILEFIMNWLANKGLVVLNLGAIYVTGEMTQRDLDRAMDKAIRQIKYAGGLDALSPEERKEIDEAVIRAARKFIVLGNTSNK